MTEDDISKTIKEIFKIEQGSSDSPYNKRRIEHSIRCEEEFRRAQSMLKTLEIKSFIIGYVCGVKTETKLLEDLKNSLSL